MLGEYESALPGVSRVTAIVLEKSGRDGEDEFNNDEQESIGQSVIVDLTDT